ncbi:hypothetical protein BP6252_02790 [Coleophoma cylindrospora]|uniref:Uncharacterized protein n=1 Tax=Coleophoma cylindrospora TaxID=1849047 RepID=A0A3D8SFS7_9HELO|nr:hypothetical protein BP6252_02790 [Coleophoma cylindrospora]
MVLLVRNVMGSQPFHTPSILQLSRLAARNGYAAPLARNAVALQASPPSPHDQDLPTTPIPNPRTSPPSPRPPTPPAPTAPHLAIYKWQITSVLSVLERLTGIFCAGTLYIFGSAYVVAPYLGWDLSSASMAAAFAAWPILAKVALKFVFAFPWALHASNGVRMLVFDAGKQMSRPQVIRSGWVAVGAAVLGSGYLAVLA